MTFNHISKIMSKMYLAVFAALSMSLASCSSDEPETTGPGMDTEVSETEIQMSGVVKAGTRLEIDRHLVIPEGESLTLEPGVTLIMNPDGVGINHVPIEIRAEGNLYCLGTEQNPVTISVDEELRTEGNMFKGLWGGIVATATCQEMVIDHAVIEYTGGQVIENSPSATIGIYTAGDDAYPNITTVNTQGKYVITNSIIRNGWSDGIYLMGGEAIVAGNTFSANGYSGAEAVNVKAGVKADIAGNIMFSPNTNGLKLSSSGQSETRSQAKANAYNNTIINAGWRRDGEKGGCVYVEKNCLANVVNNLMVNCKFRAMTPSYKSPDSPDGGYDDNSVIDYNFYASGNQASSVVYPEESSVSRAWEGYTYNHKSYSPDIDTHSQISGAERLLDPSFVNFPIGSIALMSCSYDPSWDFHLTPGSAALSGAAPAGTFTPFFANGLTVGGKTYYSPTLQAWFGASGTK